MLFDDVCYILSVLIISDPYCVPISIKHSQFNVKQMVFVFVWVYVDIYDTNPHSSHVYMQYCTYMCVCDGVGVGG